MLDRFLNSLADGLAAQVVVALVALFGLLLPRIRRFFGQTVLTASYVWRAVLFVLLVLIVSVGLTALYLSLAPVENRVVAIGTVMPGGQVIWSVRKVDVTVTPDADGETFLIELPPTSSFERRFEAVARRPTCASATMTIIDNQRASVEVDFPLGPPAGCPEQTVDAYLGAAIPFFELFIFETTRP